METNSQLIKKIKEGGYNNVYPIAYIDGIIDKESNEKLSDILIRYNNIMVPWQGDVASTRNRVPFPMRRQGIVITYITNLSEIVTEVYKGTIEDIKNNWSDNINWELVPDLKFVQDNTNKLPDGTITPEKLSPALQELISQSGSVVNMPDDEDLEQKDMVLKFKDRPYNSELANGKGYKILRKNWTNVGTKTINLLTQDVFNQSNTIYEIRYDFDLNGQEVNIPENCIFEFKGGSITNGSLKGTLLNTYVDVKWFGAKGDGTTDDTKAVNLAVSLKVPVLFSKGRYKITKSITLNNSQEIYGVYDDYFGNQAIIDLTYATEDCFILRNYCSIHNLYFTSNSVQDHNVPGTDSTITAISATNGYSHCRIYENRFYGIGYPISVNYSWCFTIRDNYIEHAKIGIDGSGEFNNVELSFNRVNYCDTSIQIGSGRNIKIDTCDFEVSSVGIYLPVGNVVTIINCYFENIHNECIKIQAGSLLHSVTICGCSFFVGSSLPTEYIGPIIALHLSSGSKVSCIRNKFLTNSAWQGSEIKCIDWFGNIPEDVVYPYFYENVLEDKYVIGTDLYTAYTDKPFVINEVNSIGITEEHSVEEGSLNDAPLGARVTWGRSSFTPPSINATGSVFTIPCTAKRRKQLYFPYNSNEIFIRTKDNDGTWSDWSRVALIKSGPTSSRPSGIEAGVMYFDTSLGKPIFTKDYDVWVDATGTEV